MTEILKPVYIPGEEGDLGHVEIHSDVGDFTGHDPTPLQVANVCAKLGLDFNDTRMVQYATENYHTDLIDIAAKSTSEPRIVKKRMGTRLIDFVSRGPELPTTITRGRNFPPEPRIMEVLDD